MPITGPSSYVATTEQFAQHWLTADGMLGPGNEITLPGGADQAGLVTQKDALVAKRAELQGTLNSKELGRGDVELKKAELLKRVVQFNDKVRATLPGSKWLNALPKAPTLTESQSKFTDPLDDANTLWQQINADPGTTADVTLVGGYAQATFATDLTALKDAYNTLNAAETSLKVVRSERNEIQDEIYGILKSYRQVLPTFFEKDAAIVESLPRLTPLPGSTPDAVVASGEWDVTLFVAVINWTESTDPNLERYEVRWSPGPVYSTEDEEFVFSQPASGPLFVQTTQGLANEGDIASFKVYVVLDTGNEKGSNAIAIEKTTP